MKELIIPFYFQGKIDTQGDYNDILKSEVDIASILNKNDEENHVEDYIESDGAIKMTKKSSSSALGKMMNSTASLNSEKSQSKENQTNPEEEKELLKELEASSRGKVKGSLFVNYFKSAKRPCTMVFLLASFLLTQILASVADIWISYW